MTRLKGSTAVRDARPWNKKEHEELTSPGYDYIRSDEFVGKFCEGCDACRLIPADMTSPEEWTCPAELDPESSRCVRWDRMDEIIDRLKGVDELWQ